MNNLANFMEYIANLSLVYGLRKKLLWITL